MLYLTYGQPAFCPKCGKPIDPQLPAVRQKVVFTMAIIRFSVTAVPATSSVRRA